MKDSWSQVRVGKDAQGHPEAVLENSRLWVRYGFKHSGDSPESMITNLVARNAPAVNQAGHLMDAAAWRTPLVRAAVKYDRPDVKTVHLEWRGQSGYPGAASDVSIFPDQPYIRIDYLSWFVNIVDIGHPGGTVTGGRYEICGAGEWKREPVFYPQVYFDRWSGDVGHENVTEVDGPGSLDYHGWFIMEVCNPANGLGYGRVVPVEAVDVIKLLKFDSDGMGFELFPYFHRPHEPFTGYLYVLAGDAAGDAEAGLALGRQLADSHQALEQALARQEVTDGVPG